MAKAPAGKDSGGAYELECLGEVIDIQPEGTKAWCKRKPGPKKKVVTRRKRKSYF